MDKNRLWGVARSSLRWDSASLVGIIVGIISMFFPWLYLKYPYAYVVPPVHVDPWSSLAWRLYPWESGFVGFFDILSAWSAAFSFFLMLFAIGMVLAAFTRIGGLVQAVGLVGFVWSVHSGEAGYERFYWYPHLTLFIGYYLGLSSALIAMFAGHRFAWNSREDAMVPSTARFAAMAPRACKVVRHSSSGAAEYLR